MSRFLLTLCVFVVSSLGAPVCGQATPGQQSAITSIVQGKSSHNYLLYLPKDYDSEKTFPLLLFLHGAGERAGDENAANGDMNLLKVHGPPKQIAAGKEFPCVVVSPQCKAGGWWEAAELSDLLDHIENEYRIDPNRVYVTGLSMGGFGTWALAAYEPERFAAIAPICGGGNAIAIRYRKPIRAAVWAFHGTADTVVPLSESQKMVAAIKSTKGTAKLTVYEGVGHDSWTQTYDNEELYTWLFSHRLTRTGSPK